MTPESAPDGELAVDDGQVVATEPSESLVTQVWAVVKRARLVIFIVLAVSQALLALVSADPGVAWTARTRDRAGRARGPRGSRRDRGDARRLNPSLAHRLILPADDIGSTDHRLSTRRRTRDAHGHQDLMLPATVTGSWPRPRWYDGGLWGRPLDTALLDVRFREQFLDAHSTVIADQERAGLDILTNGDYHLDEDFAGRSWHHYPLQRWTGFEHEELQYEGSRDSLLAFPAGTLMNEIETTWRWPRVVGKVEHNPKNPLEYAKLWRIAQARAASGKPVKFGTCSSQVLAIFLDSHTDQYDLDDKKQLIWDMAGAMNLELRQPRPPGRR